MVIIVRVVLGGYLQYVLGGRSSKQMITCPKNRPGKCFISAAGSVVTVIMFSRCVCIYSILENKISLEHPDVNSLKVTRFIDWILAADVRGEDSTLVPSS